MTRVFVTGLGAVSACGIGADALWQFSVNGKAGIREVSFENLPNQKIKTAGAISAEVWETIKQGSDQRFQDPVTAIALLAAREAVDMAGLPKDNLGPRFGSVIGSGMGGAATIDTNYWKFLHDNRARLDGMAVPKLMANAGASWVAMEFGINGPTYCLSTACSSASQSIGLAKALIQQGLVDGCLVGGTEACIVAGGFRAWEMLRVMSPTKCRPFSQDRDGMLLGEGAGVLVLESEEALNERGGTPIAELAGYGTTSDAGDLLRPDRDGAANCMNQALKDAGISSDEIGYVNAHGTGTIANDVIETEAMRAVFGEELDGVLISSTKPVHGHALGSTGALEAIVAARALQEQLAPPTMNFNEVDPRINLDPVSGKAKPFSKRAVMSNSLAFGGINASLVMTSPS